MSALLFHVKSLARLLLLATLCLSYAVALHPVVRISCRRWAHKGILRVASSDEVDYLRKISSSKQSSGSNSNNNVDIIKEIVTMTSEMNIPSLSRSKSKPKRYPSNIEERRKQLDKVLQLCRLQGGPSEKVGLTDLNQLIITAGRLSRINDAMEIYRSIGKFGFQPDLMSFNNIIWVNRTSNPTPTLPS